MCSNEHLTRHTSIAKHLSPPIEQADYGAQLLMRDAGLCTMYGQQMTATYTLSVSCQRHTTYVGTKICIALLSGLYAAVIDTKPVRQLVH